MKRKTALFFVVGILVLSVLACSFGSKVTPTNPPLVQTGGGLTLVNKSAFTDQYDTYHIVGLVKNNSAAALTSIELTVEIKDASGKSLLKDDNDATVPGLTFNTLLYTLAPGESSPFEYSYDTTNGTPASYNVAITGQQTSEASPATLQIENVEFYNDNDGTLYLSGELVNTGSQWVHINSLAGAAVDNAANVLSADWSFDYSAEITPSDDTSGNNRTPFIVSFPAPPSGGALDWQVYVDAEVADAPTRYSLAVEFTNSYFDELNDYHLVGTVTNNDTETLNTLLVGGLYAADQKVLDASYEFMPAYVEPGASMPFDITGFYSVGYNPDQAAKLDSYTAQIDYWSTYPVTNSLVTLATANDQIEKNGATWTVTGDVTNTSDQSLDSITVVVTVLDAANKIVAMDYDYVTMDDSIAPGVKNTYSTYIYLKPGVDTSSYTIQTIVQGYVSN